FAVAPAARAADEIAKIHAEEGRQWYEKFCTPCHGIGGAPGTAVYKKTGKPVDLRTYVKAHGGRVPASDGIMVVAGGNPAAVHAPVWEKIRDAQTSAISPDVSGRGVVASIAVYVRSIQTK